MTSRESPSFFPEQFLVSRPEQQRIFLTVFFGTMLNVGTRVEALYDDEETYYPGKVVAVSDDKYGIEYDDGDFREAVERWEIKETIEEAKDQDAMNAILAGDKTPTASVVGRICDSGMDDILDGILDNSSDDCEKERDRSKSEADLLRRRPKSACVRRRRRPKSGVVFPKPITRGPTRGWDGIKRWLDEQQCQEEPDDQPEQPQPETRERRDVEAAARRILRLHRPSSPILEHRPSSPILEHRPSSSRLGRPRSAHAGRPRTAETSRPPPRWRDLRSLEEGFDLRLDRQDLKVPLAYLKRRELD